MVRSRGVAPIAIFDSRKLAMDTEIHREQIRHEGISAFRVYFGRTLPDGKWVQNYAHAYAHVFAITEQQNAGDQHAFSHVATRMPGVNGYEKRGFREVRRFLQETGLPVEEIQIPRDECLKEEEFGRVFPYCLPYYRIGKDPKVCRSE
jgi:hypothetical protein